MKFSKHAARFVTLMLFTHALTACGGGSSDSGTLIEGTLTEAGGASHPRSIVFRHSEGQRIEDVRICALGRCSITDGEGQWGFVIDAAFRGGDVLFSVNGHGIDTSTVVYIPGNAPEVFLDLRHVEGGAIAAGLILESDDPSDMEPSAHHHRGESIP